MHEGCARVSAMIQENTYVGKIATRYSKESKFSRANKFIIIYLLHIVYFTFTASRIYMLLIRCNFALCDLQNDASRSPKVRDVTG